MTDYRIKFPTTEIDFTNDVGVTGQPHDNYPAPDTSPRYDWMRMELIGLLSRQSSYGPPANHRTGTISYNIHTNEFQSTDGEDILPMAAFIKAADTNLLDWSNKVENAISWNKRKMIFCGRAIQKSKVIRIPAECQPYMTSVSKIMFYKNNKLVEPNGIKILFGCPVCLDLNGDSILKTNDKFIIVMS